MSAREATTTTIIALVFGVFVGVLGVSFLAYYGGFISWDASGNARAKPVSPTPGMDMLGAYRCRKAETKHIILGGKEDGFSLEGDESVAHNSAAQEFLERAGHRLSFRSYDEPGFDKALVDEFSIPSRTAHGLIVARIKPPKKLRNDHLSIGELKSTNGRRNAASTGFANPSITKSWEMLDHPISDNDKLVSAKIEGLEFSNLTNKDPGTLLAFIRSNIDTSPSPSTKVQVSIADDTVVDFIGFAVCEEPPHNKGTVFTAGVQKIEGLENVVILSCTDAGGIECNPYGGDLICSESLPIACFKEGGKPRPYNAPIPPRNHWSGGDTKLTPAVRGDQFTNADEVHEYCAALFGPKWRASSFHDGMSNTAISYADIPDGTRAWVDVKGQEYANCWAPRPDYKDMQ